MKRHHVILPRCVIFIAILMQSYAFEVPIRCSNLSQLLKMDAAATDRRLNKISQMLQVEEKEDGGRRRFTSMDPAYEIKTFTVQLQSDSPSSSLGIELTEIDSGVQPMVFISQVEGEASQTALQVGDTIGGVVISDLITLETTGSNFSEMVEVITRARQNDDNSSLEKSNCITLEIHRLVEKVEFAANDDEAIL